jgi:hypothetical protein
LQGWSSQFLVYETISSCFMSISKLIDQTLSLQIKNAAVRHVCDAFNGLVILDNQCIELRTIELIKLLEIQFGRSLLSKYELIENTITSVIQSGHYQNGRFFCAMESHKIVEEKQSSMESDRHDMTLPSSNDKKSKIAGSLPVSAISVVAIKKEVSRLVRDAVKTRSEVSFRIIRQLLENKFSCDLKARNQIILEAIQSSLEEFAPFKI